MHTQQRLSVASTANIGAAADLDKLLLEAATNASPEFFPRLDLAITHIETRSKKDGSRISIESIYPAASTMPEGSISGASGTLSPVSGATVSTAPTSPRLGASSLESDTPVAQSQGLLSSESDTNVFAVFHIRVSLPRLAFSSNVASSSGTNIGSPRSPLPGTSSVSALTPLGASFTSPAQTTSPPGQPSAQSFNSTASDRVVSDPASAAQSLDSGLLTTQANESNESKSNVTETYDDQDIDPLIGANAADLDASGEGNDNDDDDDEAAISRPPGTTCSVVTSKNSAPQSSAGATEQAVSNCLGSTIEGLQSAQTSVNDASSVEFTSWTVKRRYRDFSWLHEKLRVSLTPISAEDTCDASTSSTNETLHESADDPNHDGKTTFSFYNVPLESAKLPQLPPKRIIGSSVESGFVRNRRTALEAYLNGVLKIREAYVNPAFLQFLQFPRGVVEFYRARTQDYMSKVQSNQPTQTQTSSGRFSLIGRSNSFFQLFQRQSKGERSLTNSSPPSQPASNSIATSEETPKQVAAPGDLVEAKMIFDAVTSSQTEVMSEQRGSVDAKSKSEKPTEEATPIQERSGMGSRSLEGIRGNDQQLDSWQQVGLTNSEFYGEKPVVADTLFSRITGRPTDLCPQSIDDISPPAAVMAAEAIIWHASMRIALNDLVASGAIPQNESPALPKLDTKEATRLAFHTLDEQKLVQQNSVTAGLERHARRLSRKLLRLFGANLMLVIYPTCEKERQRLLESDEYEHLATLQNRPTSSLTLKDVEQLTLARDSIVSHILQRISSVWEDNVIQYVKYLRTLQRARQGRCLGAEGEPSRTRLAACEPAIKYEDPTQTKIDMPRLKTGEPSSANDRSQARSKLEEQKELYQKHLARLSELQDILFARLGGSQLSKEGDIPTNQILREIQETTTLISTLSSAMAEAASALAAVEASPSPLQSSPEPSKIEDIQEQSEHQISNLAENDRSVRATRGKVRKSMSTVSAPSELRTALNEEEDEPASRYSNDPSGQDMALVDGTTDDARTEMPAAILEEHIHHLREARRARRRERNRNRLSLYHSLQAESPELRSPDTADASQQRTNSVPNALHGSPFGNAPIIAASPSESTAESGALGISHPMKVADSLLSKFSTPFRNISTGLSSGTNTLTIPAGVSPSQATVGNIEGTYDLWVPKPLMGSPGDLDESVSRVSRDSQSVITNGSQLLSSHFPGNGFGQTTSLLSGQNLLPQSIAGAGHMRHRSFSMHANAIPVGSDSRHDSSSVITPPSTHSGRWGQFLARHTELMLIRLGQKLFLNAAAHPDHHIDTEDVETNGDEIRSPDPRGTHLRHPALAHTHMQTRAPPARLVIRDSTGNLTLNRSLSTRESRLSGLGTVSPQDALREANSSHHLLLSNSGNDGSGEDIVHPRVVDYAEHLIDEGNDEDDEADYDLPNELAARSGMQVKTRASKSNVSATRSRTHARRFQSIPGRAHILTSSASSSEYCDSQAEMDMSKLPTKVNDDSHSKPSQEQSHPGQPAHVTKEDGYSESVSIATLSNDGNSQQPTPVASAVVGFAAITDDAKTVAALLCSDTEEEEDDDDAVSRPSISLASLGASGSGLVRRHSTSHQLARPYRSSSSSSTPTRASSPPSGSPLPGKVGHPASLVPVAEKDREDEDDESACDDEGCLQIQSPDINDAEELARINFDDDDDDEEEVDYSESDTRTHTQNLPDESGNPPEGIDYECPSEVRGKTRHRWTIRDAPGKLHNQLSVPESRGESSDPTNNGKATSCGEIAESPSPQNLARDFSTISAQSTPVQPTPPTQHNDDITLRQRSVDLVAVPEAGRYGNETNSQVSWIDQVGRSEHIRWRWRRWYKFMARRHVMRHGMRFMPDDLASRGSNPHEWTRARGPLRRHRRRWHFSRLFVPENQVLPKSPEDQALAFNTILKELRLAAQGLFDTDQSDGTEPKEMQEKAAVPDSDSEGNDKPFRVLPLQESVDTSENARIAADLLERLLFSRSALRPGSLVQANRLHPFRPRTSSLSGSPDAQGALISSSSQDGSIMKMHPSLSAISSVTALLRHDQQAHLRRYLNPHDAGDRSVGSSVSRTLTPQPHSLIPHSTSEQDLSRVGRLGLGLHDYHKTGSMADGSGLDAAAVAADVAANAALEAAYEAAAASSQRSGSSGLVSASSRLLRSSIGAETASYGLTQQLQGSASNAHQLILPAGSQQGQLPIVTVSGPSGVAFSGDPSATAGTRAQEISSLSTSSPLSHQSPPQVRDGASSTHQRVLSIEDALMGGNPAVDTDLHALSGLGSQKGYPSPGSRRDSSTLTTPPVSLVPRHGSHSPFVNIALEAERQALRGRVMEASEQAIMLNEEYKVEMEKITEVLPPETAVLVKHEPEPQVVPTTEEGSNLSLVDRTVQPAELLKLDFGRDTFFALQEGHLSAATDKLVETLAMQSATSYRRNESALEYLTKLSNAVFNHVLTQQRPVGPQVGGFSPLPLPYPTIGADGTVLNVASPRSQPASPLASPHSVNGVINRPDGAVDLLPPPAPLPLMPMVPGGLPHAYPLPPGPPGAMSPYMSTPRQLPMHSSFNASTPSITVTLHPHGSYALDLLLPDGDLDCTLLVNSRNGSFPHTNIIDERSWPKPLMEALWALISLSPAELSSAANNSSAGIRIVVAGAPLQVPLPQPGISVRSVTLINSAVKVLKTQLGSVHLDITFGQKNAMLSTKLFDLVNALVEQKNLFKRSLRLLRTWAEHDAGILGSSTHLMSSYSLRTVMLCVFNMYHAHIKTPLQALYLTILYCINFNWHEWVLTIFGPLRKTELTSAMGRNGTGSQVQQPPAKTQHSGQGSSIQTRAQELASSVALFPHLLSGARVESDCEMPLLRYAAAGYKPPLAVPTATLAKWPVGCRVPITNSSYGEESATNSSAANANVDFAEFYTTYKTQHDVNPAHHPCAWPRGIVPLLKEDVMAVTLIKADPLFSPAPDTAQSLRGGPNSEDAGKTSRGDAFSTPLSFDLRPGLNILDPLQPSNNLGRSVALDRVPRVLSAFVAEFRRFSHAIAVTRLASLTPRLTDGIWAVSPDILMSGEVWAEAARVAKDRAESAKRNVAILAEQYASLLHEADGRSARASRAPSPTIPATSTGTGSPLREIRPLGQISTRAAHLQAMAVLGEFLMKQLFAGSIAAYMSGYGAGGMKPAQRVTTESERITVAGEGSKPIDITNTMASLLPRSLFAQIESADPSHRVRNEVSISLSSSAGANVDEASKGEQPLTRSPSGTGDSRGEGEGAQTSHRDETLSVLSSHASTSVSTALTTGSKRRTRTRASRTALRRKWLEEERMRQESKSKEPEGYHSNETASADQLATEHRSEAIVAAVDATESELVQSSVAITVSDVNPTKDVLLASTEIEGTRSTQVCFAIESNGLQSSQPATTMNNTIAHVDARLMDDANVIPPSMHMQMPPPPPDFTNVASSAAQNMATSTAAMAAAAHIAALRSEDLSTADMRSQLMPRTANGEASLSGLPMSLGGPMQLSQMPQHASSAAPTPLSPAPSYVSVTDGNAAGTVVPTSVANVSMVMGPALPGTAALNSQGQQPAVAPLTTAQGSSSQNVAPLVSSASTSSTSSPPAPTASATAGNLGVSVPGHLSSSTILASSQSPAQVEARLVEGLEEILRENGPTCLGKLGSQLHHRLGDHRIPSVIKALFGGLKHLLQRHADRFIIGQDQPYNPTVSLNPDFVETSETRPSHSSEPAVAMNAVSSRVNPNGGAAQAQPTAQSASSAGRSRGRNRMSGGGHAAFSVPEHPQPGVQMNSHHPVVSHSGPSMFSYQTQQTAIIGQSDSKVNGSIQHEQLPHAHQSSTAISYQPIPQVPSHQQSYGSQAQSQLQSHQIPASAQTGSQQSLMHVQTHLQQQQQSAAYPQSSQHTLNPNNVSSMQRVGPRRTMPYQYAAQPIDQQQVTQTATYAVSGGYQVPVTAYQGRQQQPQMQALPSHQPHHQSQHQQFSTMHQGISPSQTAHQMQSRRQSMGAQHYQPSNATTPTGSNVPGQPTMYAPRSTAQQSFTPMQMQSVPPPYPENSTNPQK